MLSASARTRCPSASWLLKAIDDCPFVTRRVALQQTLADSVPEGRLILADLSRDPRRRPVTLLPRRTDLRPENATAEEATWMMAGSLLELPELGGPEAVTEQLNQSLDVQPGHGPADDHPLDLRRALE